MAQIEPNPECPERLRLLDEFLAATRATIGARAGNTRRFAYAEELRNAQAAELAAAQALDKHRREHGC